ncbi:MAG: biopolymer transporter ExbD [Paludibacteraceae bacterium]|nr:biopolymer transporter ExbD [Paludibacteraceae bacterium]
MARSKKKVPEVNSSSTADIAFLLLVFFLMTTTMAVNKGLSRQLPPYNPEQEKVDAKVNVRNMLTVLINSEDQLLVTVGGETKYAKIDELREITKEFITNRHNSPLLPDKFEEEIDYFGKVMVTKDHIISLQNDRGTSYSAYIEVTNELIAAYNDVRNELSKEKFGMTYAELEERAEHDVEAKNKLKALKTYYPLKISECEPKNYGGKK